MFGRRRGSHSRWIDVLLVVSLVVLIGTAGWIGTTLLKSGTGLTSAGAKLAAAAIGVGGTLVVAVLRHTLEVSRRREILIWKAKREDYRQVLSNVQDWLTGAEATPLESGLYRLHLIGDETTSDKIEKLILDECGKRPGDKRVEDLAEAMGRDLQRHLKSGGG